MKMSIHLPYCNQKLSFKHTQSFDNWFYFFRILIINYLISQYNSLSQYKFW